MSTTGAEQVLSSAVSKCCCAAAVAVVARVVVDVGGGGYVDIAAFVVLESISFPILILSVLVFVLLM